MDLNGFINRWSIWGSKVNSKLSILILFLLSIAYGLSDWIYSYFTFSEYILFFITLFLLSTFHFKLYKKQVLFISFIALFLIAHLLYHVFIARLPHWQLSLAAIIKLLFYITTLFMVINYIRVRSQIELFLKINNITAIFLVFIGLFIIILLYRESTIPQNVLWRFTRTDESSYYYESSQIIRSRSLFSEPAHFGFYLNSLLLANLFYWKKLKYNYLTIVLLTLGIISTFSYSMIFIMIIIYFCRLLDLYIKKRIAFRKWTYFVIALILLAVIYNWDIINVTVIQRTLAIISGEDISARIRLINSWQYVSRDTLLMGNGIGQTPIITNVYAYMLSDFGLIGFIGKLSLTAYISFKNWKFGIVFLLLNFAKGGYLSSGYWFMMIIFIIYGLVNRDHDSLKNIKDQ